MPTTKTLEELQAAWKKAGQTTLERHGRDHFVKMGLKNKEKYGSDYFKKIRSGAKFKAIKTDTLTEEQ